MLMVEGLKFWHISCRFDIKNMEWALIRELQKLCKLSNIYTPKASTSAWGFTLNKFFSYIYSIHAYLFQFFNDKLEKSITEGKPSAETWQRTSTLLLLQCFDVKYQNGSVLAKTMRSVMIYVKYLPK